MRIEYIEAYTYETYEEENLRVVCPGKKTTYRIANDQVKTHGERGLCLRILDQFMHQFALRILCTQVEPSTFSNRFTEPPFYNGGKLTQHPIEGMILGPIIVKQFYIGERFESRSPTQGTGFLTVQGMVTMTSFIQ